MEYISVALSLERLTWDRACPVGAPGLTRPAGESRRRPSAEQELWLSLECATRILRP